MDDGTGVDTKINIKAAVEQLWEEEYKGRYTTSSSADKQQQQQQPEASKPYHRIKNDRYGGLHAHY